MRTADDAALATRVVALLQDLAQRASRQMDLRTAIDLHRRACALLAPDDPRRLDLVPTLAGLLIHVGEFDRAGGVLADGQAAATAAGDDRAMLRIQVMLTVLSVLTDPGIDVAAAAALAERARTRFAETGDVRGRAEAGWLAGWLATRGLAPFPQSGDLDDATVQLLTDARALGDRRLENMAVMNAMAHLIYGPIPVETALLRLEEFMESARGTRELESMTVGNCATLEAMRGRFDRAKALLARSDALYDEAKNWVEIGQGVVIDGDFHAQALLGSAAARLSAVRAQGGEAERLAREAERIAAASGMPNLHGDMLVSLADVLNRAGRAEEAARALGEARARYEAKGNVASCRRVDRLLAERDSGT